eukprot:4258919-Pleurochrysis_carterae.AAC.1
MERDGQGNWVGWAVSWSGARQLGGVGSLLQRLPPGVALLSGPTGRHTVCATLPAVGSQTSHLPLD